MQVGAKTKLEFDFRAKLAKWPVRNHFFFSVQLSFEGNLYRTYVVKVFLVGITILSRTGRASQKVPKTTLEFEWRLGAVPEAYELRMIFVLRTTIIKLLE